MRNIFLVLAGAAVFSAALFSQQSANPFLGRWDLTVTTSSATYPDWIEVINQNGKPAAHIQPRSGGAKWATDVAIQGSKLTLTLDRDQWELTATGNSIGGGISRNGNMAAKITGNRAPALERPVPSAWSEAKPIFNGKDLSGWEGFGPGANNWVAENGDLLNKTKGQNIRTTAKYNDFKLHIEYNCPDEGNSGIYLRGRYEVQVEYEKPGVNDAFHSMGAIYSFIAPNIELPRKPGQWETFDITLVGRKLWVMRDGVQTIAGVDIPGPTGGAIDSNEAEPGPFYIQGDHTGGMRYRNITIQLPK